MRISKITIKDFKALHDVTFEPGRVNVFIGSNGAGKSTILEAIGLLSAAMTDRVDDNSLSRKGIRLSSPQMYKSSFKKNTSRKAVSIGLEVAWSQEERTDSYKYSVNLNTPNEDAAWRYHAESFSANDQKWGRSGASKPAYNNYVGMFMLNTDEKLQAARPSVEPFRNYAIFQPITPVLRGIQQDSVQINPIGLSGGRLAEALEELQAVSKDGDKMLGDLYIDEILEMLDWAETIGVSAPSKSKVNSAIPTTRRVIYFQDRYMRAGDLFTAYDASEGALYVLFLLCMALHHKAPEVFAVDSFDHAMHPRLARAVTRLFCDQLIAKKKTAFVTTHNPLALDGLDLTNDDIRLFTVERSAKTGFADIGRVQISKEMIESGQSLSRLWVDGRLGGVPNLL